MCSIVYANCPGLFYCVFGDQRSNIYSNLGADGVTYVLFARPLLKGTVCIYFFHIRSLWWTSFRLNIYFHQPLLRWFCNEIHGHARCLVQLRAPRAGFVKVNTFLESFPPERRGHLLTPVSETGRTGEREGFPNTLHVYLGRAPEKIWLLS